ncbi:cytochrome P450 734A1-like [Lycium ferocissimum]|uniref:cytochrome P450 734A1-like n=1 Tax=Lycium ferocissimum TaxID=112874 RepID=UPI00281616B8|nr:cytochrome P450 734A1-like [Lycium ferocissimum]
METSFHWLCLLTFSYVLLLFAQKAFIHLWWTPKRIQKHFKNQGITGPKYHFLFGNLKEIASFTTSSWPSSFISHDILPRVLPFYHHWKKIYGSTFVIWFGPTARVTISDPALIRDIFVLKSDNFEKNESPALVKKLEGDGLLSLKGEKWAHHRKIITPTFYIENLKLMIPMMGKRMTEMLDKWSKMSNTSGKVEIEVSEMFSTLAEDVITRIVFGNSYEDGRAIFELQAQQMVYATEAYQKVFIPGYRFLPTKKNRISWRLDKEVRKSLMKLIEERRKISTHQLLSDECPNDLLEVMIKATTSHEYRNSSNITVNDIVEECKTIFFAGKHTTSNLLTWTTILLAMHPQWQELAREEVLRVCGARDIPSKDDLAKLKTLGMIINESVRLYPPAVAAIRRAKIDTQLGDFTLPQGTELLIPIIAIHHDPVLWGQDANEFNPARFSRGVAHAAKHPMAFMPFGLGARRCVGQNLAVLQAKLAIAMILQRFAFDLSPSYQHAPTILMLLCPQHGAPIIFQKL